MSNVHLFPPKQRTKFIFGGPIDSAKVHLRLFGDDLTPETVSSLLEAKPDTSCKKGDKRFSSAGVVIEKTGKWILHSTLPEHALLEDQIMSVLNQVSDDLDVWETLSKRYKMDIFCGLFVEAFNRGFVLSNRLLTELSKRKLQINMDIYSYQD